MPEPIAVTPNCEHHYACSILGGHPIHVRICTFCHTPDWTDLAEQANVLYRCGREEALAGKPLRDRLSAYDRPSRDAAETAPDGAAPDPLAPFRALADQYAAKAAESRRNANTAPLTIRTANQGIAAGWQSAEFLLRHTLTDLDNHRTTPDNPVASAVDENAAAHFILTTICERNGYRPPQPGIQITADDLARIDRLVEYGTPFGEAVSDVIGLAAWQAQQARVVLDQRINDGCCTATSDLRERYAAEIADEIYEYRERTMFWEESGGVTEEITRLAVRGAMSVRDQEMQQLRAELDILRAVATGYCPHCGRGDCAPTPDQYLEQVRLADEADIIVDRIRAIAVDLRNDPDARYWANLIDTALDTPEYPS